MPERCRNDEDAESIARMSEALTEIRRQASTLVENANERADIRPLPTHEPRRRDPAEPSGNIVGNNGIA